jgi:ribosomal subunit interface protein
MNQLPIDITVRDIAATEAIEARIREKAEKLVQFYPRIEFCKVVVKVPQKHKHNGKLYNVRIEILVPGKKILANRNRDEDLYVSIRDSFNAIGRQLEDYARRQRGEVKSHAETLMGTINRLFGDYGFIEANDGKEYYFSDVNVLHPDFEHLRIGDNVHFIESVAGDGLQALHVREISQHEA